MISLSPLSGEEGISQVETRLAFSQFLWLDAGKGYHKDAMTFRRRFPFVLT